MQVHRAQPMSSTFHPHGKPQGSAIRESANWLPRLPSIRPCMRRARQSRPPHDLNDFLVMRPQIRLSPHFSAAKSRCCRGEASDLAPSYHPARRSSSGHSLWHPDHSGRPIRPVKYRSRCVSLPAQGRRLPRLGGDIPRSWLARLNFLSQTLHFVGRKKSLRPESWRQSHRRSCGTNASLQEYRCAVTGV